MFTGGLDWIPDARLSGSDRWVKKILQSHEHVRTNSSWFSWALAHGRDSFVQAQQIDHCLYDVDGQRTGRRSIPYTIHQPAAHSPTMAITAQASNLRSLVREQPAHLPTECKLISQSGISR